MTTFTPVHIPLSDGTSIELSGEIVSEHFAIVPIVGHYQKDEPLRLLGGVKLVHTPTGRGITSDAWLDLRVLAPALESLPLDWDDLDGWTDEQKALPYAEARRLAASNSDDNGWPWPEWAGDEAMPALSMLADSLDSAVGSYDRFSKISDLGKQARDILADSDLSKNIDAHLMHGHSSATVNEYGLAYLLAVLHRVDPEAADRAARDLAAAWDAGDSMSEWVYQWRDELAQGRPLTLHGFPTRIDITEPAS